MKKLFKTLAIMLVMVTIMGVVPVSAKNPNKSSVGWNKTQVYYDAWNRDLGGVVYLNYSVTGYWNFGGQGFRIENAKDNITKAYANLVGNYVYNLGTGQNGESLCWCYAYFSLKNLGQKEYSIGDWTIKQIEYDIFDYVHYRWAKLKKVIKKKAKALKVDYTETIKDRNGYTYDNSDWVDLFKYTKTDKKLKKHNYKCDWTGQYKGKKWLKFETEKQEKINTAFDAMKAAINECKTVEDFYYVLDHIETMIYEYEDIMKTCIFPYYYNKSNKVKVPKWFGKLGF